MIHKSSVVGPGSRHLWRKVLRKYLDRCMTQCDLQQACMLDLVLAVKGGIDADKSDSLLGDQRTLTVIH